MTVCYLSLKKRRLKEIKDIQKIGRRRPEPPQQTSRKSCKSKSLFSRIVPVSPSILPQALFSNTHSADNTMPKQMTAPSFLTTFNESIGNSKNYSP